MMKPSTIKPRKAAPPGGRHPAYQHAFARLDEALAKNTRPEFTEAEKTQMLIHRIWGAPPRKEGL
jgi:hypothetical protein